MRGRVVEDDGGGERSGIRAAMTKADDQLPSRPDLLTRFAWTPAISFFAVSPGSPHPSTIFRQPQWSSVPSHLTSTHHPTA